MTEPFMPEGLGEWTDPDKFQVTAERITEYAKATNDPIQAHLDGEVASPVFAIVPVFNAMIPAVFSVVPVEYLGKVLHGKQDFVFHRPIKAGDNLVARVKPIGYQKQSTGSVVVQLLETRTDEGELVNEQYMTAFFRGVDSGGSAGETAPDHTFPEQLRDTEPVAVVTAHVDEDQTFRYSPASGDPMPIHLDAEMAQASGLPGIIAHGLCIQAFTSWAVLTSVAGSKTERLKRFAVRFAKPVLPGQDITTRIWASPDTPGTYHFETTVDDVAVIKDGLAEVAD
ncbi:dehydratase [Pseudonocardiaceae bacterium YIM PH 21723]|nr:dehydratase [Pseudonocardiaceae bacterium YIM PH 21723]